MSKEKDFLQKIVEAPAVALERTVEASHEFGDALVEQTHLKKAGEYWQILGPGLTTGAADDDPSGIATYSQTGAQYGFQLLWLAPLTFPLMAVVQEMCARIGLVTGWGLAANIRRHFHPRVIQICTILLLIANTFNIGADLGAMGQAAVLVMPRIPAAHWVVFFAVVSLLLQIYTTYERYAKYLKWLALILFSYVFSALLAGLNWSDVLAQTVRPTMQLGHDQLLIISAILGTTISPYLFFWQTSQEVEERILEGKTTIRERRGASAEDIKRMRIDVWSGMFLSNLVMFFIIAACGGVLYSHGITNIATTAQAAEALRPLAGDITYALFTAGVIGTGLLAIPVLAGSTSYAIAESFNWKMGLHRSLRDAYGFYGVIIISMGVGLLINFLGLDPIRTLIYSAVANSLVAPFILALIVLIASRHDIMGHWMNRRLTTVVGWGVTGIMTIAGIATVISSLL